MAMTVASPKVAGRRGVRPAGRMVAARAAEAKKGDMGFDTMRSGVKVAAEESLLTPRFYTTDFDEMEELFSSELNPNLDMDEIEAVVNEFRQDYNKTHFVRNADFKDAADGIQGATRKIFVEFLERSCTAEFSGFLLYKELGRRLKKINPAVAEGFTLMSRDEALLTSASSRRTGSTPSSSPNSFFTLPTSQSALATGATSLSTVICSATPTTSCTLSSSTSRTGVRCIIHSVLDTRCLLVGYSAMLRHKRCLDPSFRICALLPSVA